MPWAQAHSIQPTRSRMTHGCSEKLDASCEHHASSFGLMYCRKSCCSIKGHPSALLVQHPHGSKRQNWQMPEWQVRPTPGTDRACAASTWQQLASTHPQVSLQHQGTPFSTAWAASTWQQGTEVADARNGRCGTHLAVSGRGRGVGGQGLEGTQERRCVTTHHILED